MEEWHSRSKRPTLIRALPRRSPGSSLLPSRDPDLHSIHRPPSTPYSTCNAQFRKAEEEKSEIGDRSERIGFC